MIQMILLLIPKSIRHILLAVLRKTLHVLMINLARQLFFTEEKMKSINLLKQLLKKTSTGKMIKSILIKI